MISDNIILDNQCNNCLKVFKFNSELERHMLATRQCKKVELDKNGKIIPNKDFKCDDCNQLFAHKRSLIKHQKEYCKGKQAPITNSHNTVSTTTTTSQSHNPITTTTTTSQSYNNNITDNSNNIINNNITNDNKFNINLDTVDKYIKPKNNFEIIKDNFINVNNVEKYIQVFLKQLDAQEVSIKYLVIIIRDILIEKYITNIDICNRNIITMNSKYKMHYYKNNEWYSDAGYEKFVTQCIMKLLDQFKYAINEKKIIISRIRNNEIDYLKKYDFRSDDSELNMIVNRVINKKYDEMLYKKILDDRMKVYNQITKSLFNMTLITNILSAMKTHLYIDEELQKIIKNIHLQNNIDTE